MDQAITENWWTGATIGLMPQVNAIKAAGLKCVVVWLTPQDQAAFVQDLHSRLVHRTRTSGLFLISQRNYRRSQAKVQIRLDQRLRNHSASVNIEFGGRSPADRITAYQLPVSRAAAFYL